MHIAVLGATGYTGLVLLRLLGNHDAVKQITAVSSSLMGRPVLSADPGLGIGGADKMSPSGGLFVSVDEAVAAKPDVVFAALPHLASAKICEPFFGRSVVIDLSADFRITDPEVFLKAYGEPLPRPDLLHQAAYGLSELRREEVRKADIIANPGCFPTCILLPVLPVLKRFSVKGTITATALTGISGAGKKATERNLFCSRSENVCAYNPGRVHRHAWEINQEVHALTPDRDVFFFPHLVPMKRGMAATIHLETEKELRETDIRDLFAETYGTCPFIGLREDALPETGDVWGSNRCDIAWRTDGQHLMLFSVIDNLVKGASGQAVQNMNIRFGLDETAGLPVSSEL